MRPQEIARGVVTVKRDASSDGGGPRRAGAKKRRGENPHRAAARWRTSSATGTTREPAGASAARRPMPSGDGWRAGQVLQCRFRARRITANDLLQHGAGTEEPHAHGRDWRAERDGNLVVGEFVIVAQRQH